jgi:hypothetical protein
MGNTRSEIARIRHRHVSIFVRAALKHGACNEASVEMVQDEIEGWCLLMKVADEEVSEEHLFPPYLENVYVDAAAVLKRFRDRNGWADIPPEPLDVRKLAAKFEEALGLVVPACEKERLKWN